MSRLLVFLFVLLFGTTVNATEIYRIKLENKVDGRIGASYNQGVTWESIGRVVYPTDQANEIGYSAAKWVKPGQVAASAVNAIHIKVGSYEASRTIFSLLPKEFITPPTDYKSYLSPDASIYTSMSAGKVIFGSGLAPFIGNQVLVNDLPLEEGYIPALGDLLTIIVARPSNYPKEILFENKKGGNVTIEYFSGEKKIIAKVRQPVLGVGRFYGSQFIEPGRIRANHAGVICVSTSPRREFGGFQIIPADHADNLGYVVGKAQWLIASPLEGGATLEGQAPLFAGFIQPRYDQEDYLGRFLVEVKYIDSDKWQPMPVYEINKFYLNRGLPNWTNSALKKVRAIRIFFPLML